MSKLKIGDEVVLKKSAGYLDLPANPQNMTGIVEDVDMGYHMPVRVKWENGFLNDYEVNDLDLSKKPKEDIQIHLDTNQIKHTAVFLSRNSVYLDEPPNYFEKMIYGLIKEGVGNDELIHTGTGGATVLFDRTEDNSTVFIEVLVDVGISQGVEYEHVQMKDGKLIKEIG